ncbi:MAG: hypothetical protein ACYTGL_27135 [Planctomycetota bacterium]
MSSNRNGNPRGSSGITITQAEFLDDRQGRTFADVVNDPDSPFADLLAFFNDPGRQRRMEESELHHDRAPLAGVVRELEAYPAFQKFLSGIHARRTTRFRQAVGVLVRMIMQRRGWQKTGRKGSLGVRAASTTQKPDHNTGGLAFWFIRAERYEREEGMPYRSVKALCAELDSGASQNVSDGSKRQNGTRRNKPKRQAKPRSTGKKCQE